MLSPYSGQAVGIKESKKVFSPSFPCSLFQELHHLTEMGHVFHGVKLSGHSMEEVMGQLRSLG